MWFTFSNLLGNSNYMIIAKLRFIFQFSFIILEWDMCGHIESFFFFTMSFVNSIDITLLKLARELFKNKVTENFRLYYM